jgi:hypothetical protein
VAVFPERIVLKNSTDDDATIRAAIGIGGSDQINQGEIVLGIYSGGFRLYGLESGSAVRSIESIPFTTDGDLLTRVSGDLARIGIGTEGQVLSVSSGSPAWITFNPVSGIDDLTDVDTSTVAPVIGQVLVWDGSNWIPGAGGGGGGSGGAGTVQLVSEAQTASAGAATFTALGKSGTLIDFSSDLTAWITLYPTAADRTADASRSFGTDPTIGSGVLADVYVTGGGTVLASPGTSYFNNDTVAADAVYAAVRDTSGVAVNATVTIKAFGHFDFGGLGTNRVSDFGVSTAGLLSLSGIGTSGLLVDVTSSQDAWIVFYTTSAARSADSSRAFSVDPQPNSGVLAEFYVASGTTVQATPGTYYFNNDITPGNSIYLAVRDTNGVAVVSSITVTAYAETSYTGFSGGTYGSG